MVNWYSANKGRLEEVIEIFFSNPLKIKNKKMHGLIVPHAGYEFSGEIAGKVFSLLKNKNFKKAIVVGPSHRCSFYGLAKLPNIKTPLGRVEIINSDIKELDGLNYEHSIDNQIPFLQVLNINKILPVVVGNLTKEDAKKIASEILKCLNKETVLIISTDLSHFLNYITAKEKDSNTIKAIKKLDIEYFLKEENSACGLFPLMILIELCKLKNWKPRLIEYKNSGDIIGNKNSVVGYATFVF